MNKSFSEFESPRQYQILIENCLLKCLSSSQKVLQQTVSKALRKKIQQICSSYQHNNNESYREPAVQAIQHFIFTLLGLIQNLSQKVSLCRQGSNSVDNSQMKNKQSNGYDNNAYQSLQKCMQKAQSDIRKHIRLEQQMKIYINDLQDKVQFLEKQVKHEKKRYQQLFNNFSNVNVQKRQLQQKVKRLDYKLGNKMEKRNQLQSKPSKVMSQAFLREELQMYRSSTDKNQISVPGMPAPRKKSLVEKINQRSKKMVRKQNSYQNSLLYVNGSIDVKLAHPNQSKKEKKHSFDVEIKDNIKTIELHQQVKKPVRRVVRLQTQCKETKPHRKHQRSSSLLQ